MGRGRGLIEDGAERQVLNVLEGRLGENLAGLTTHDLHALLQKDGLLEKLGKLVGSASISGVEIPPEVLGAFFHKGGQHVFLGRVANVANQLEAVQIDFISIHVSIRETRSDVTFFLSSC